MIWILYNAVFALVFTLLLPKFLLHMRRRGGYWENFWERVGNYSPETRSRLAEGGRFWVHGVSVGEVFVALKLMDEMRERDPDIRFVLSTSTSTGNRLARKRIDPRDQLIYFPVDCPFLMARILDLIRPCGLALIETELWPNLIRKAKRRGIPIYTINGRISDSSYRGYRKLKVFTSRLLPLFERIFVQSDTDRERFCELGAPPDRIDIVGSGKYETAFVSPEDERKGAEMLRRLGCGKTSVIMLGASTWNGEEDLLLDVYARERAVNPKLFLVLAPRHAERREEILALIEKKGLSAVTRQQMQAEPEADFGGADLFLLDTTGELSCFYPHAALVFVGKSLCRHGGQNPIEPAACGRAVVVGPNMENFRIVMSDLLAGDAIVQVDGPEHLRSRLSELLADRTLRDAYGRRAAAVVEAKRGALKRTVASILTSRD